MDLAEKIQSLRKQKNISQEQLAEMMGISRQSISKWESQQSVPELDKIVRLSDIFGVSTDYLLKDTQQDQGVRAISDSNAISTKKKPRVIVGIICVAFSVTSIFIMWVLSKVYPAPIVNYNVATEQWLVGFENFLWFHSLEGFYTFCFVIALAGILLLVFPKLKKSKIIIKRKRTK